MDNFTTNCLSILCSILFIHFLYIKNDITKKCYPSSTVHRVGKSKFFLSKPGSQCDLFIFQGDTEKRNRCIPAELHRREQKLPNVLSKGKVKDIFFPLNICKK